jgi:acylphosphatase
MPAETDIAVRLLIEGRVQGVGYRQWMAGAARGLGLRGFVRNLPDGRVEAVVAGEPERIEQLVRRAGRGPRLAHVTRVTRLPAPKPDEAGFEVRHME